MARSPLKEDPVKKAAFALLALVFPILAMGQVGIPHNQAMNTNAYHGLHVLGYQGPCSLMASVTNMWADDTYYCTDTGTMYYYQSSVPAPTPAFGSGSWQAIVSAVPSATPTAVPTALVVSNFVFSFPVPTPGTGNVTVGGWLPTGGGITLSPGTWELGANGMIDLGSPNQLAVTINILKALWSLQDGQNNNGRPNAANVKSISNGTFGAGYFYTDNILNPVNTGSLIYVSPPASIFATAVPVTLFWVPQFQYYGGSVTEIHVQTTLQAWQVSAATQ
jgi:hypothetical protein